MTDIIMPPLIQAVGLACAAVADVPATEPALGRKPIAAAVLTLALRDDGHRELTVARHSDSRSAEFPLPWLVDQSLVAGAPVIVTPTDAAMLAVEAMARRFWAEPRLAGLAQGAQLVDPTRLAGNGSVDEAALQHRLGVPVLQTGIMKEEGSQPPSARERAMTAALASAATRLMLWAHHASFAAAAPDIFFETLLPLGAWLADEADRSPSLEPLARSRPIRRATSFASYYRDYRRARDAGDTAAAWVTFEDGLFHT